MSEKWQPAWCSAGCFNWLKQSNFRAVWGARGGKWWDRRSLLLFYSAVCHPPTLPACATVNIEIYYTLAFHHLLRTLRTVLRTLFFLLKKKRKFVLLHCMSVWGCSSVLWFHRDHKTLRCYWWLVNQNKWCNSIKRAFKARRLYFSKCPLCIHMAQAEQGTIQHCANMKDRLFTLHFKLH